MIRIGLSFLLAVAGLLNLTACGAKSSGSSRTSNYMEPVQFSSQRVLKAVELPENTFEKIKTDWQIAPPSSAPGKNDQFVEVPPTLQRIQGQAIGLVQPPVSAQSNAMAQSNSLPQSKLLSQLTEQNLLANVDTFARVDTPVPLFWDESYRTIRVRLYPHLWVPSGDPYQLSESPKRLTLVRPEGLQVFDHRSLKLITLGKKIDFDFANSKIQIDQKEYPLTEVRLVPVGSDAPTEVEQLKIKNPKWRPHYRGSFLVTPAQFRVGKGVVTEWSLVNFIDLETYLTAVVPAEIGSDSADEAVKTQAIAARSYALYHVAITREVIKRPEYDVEATTSSQIYMGVHYENTRVTQLLQSNRGLVATFNKQIILAVYSANSGGQTCSAEECWNAKGFSYLSSVPDHPGVLNAPRGTSKLDVPAATLISFLTDRKFVKSAPEKIERWTVSKKSESGRTRGFDFKTPEIVGLDAPATASLLSSLGVGVATVEIEPSPKPRTFQLVYHGLGHGVGLSQWGAILMAKDGRTAEEIIKTFYKGVEIQDMLKK